MNHTSDQPTSAPTSKVAAAGIGGSVAIVLIWLAGQFGVELSAEVASAITAIVAFAAGYFKRSSTN